MGKEFTKFYIWFRRFNVYLGKWDGWQTFYGKASIGILLCIVCTDGIWNWYERGEANPSVEMAAKLAIALDVFLDYLVGNTDVELDRAILDKVVSIQKLPDEDRNCIMYSIDGLIQHAKTRLAYK